MAQKKYARFLVWTSEHKNYEGKERKEETGGQVL
jgi:hypothetical protein